MDTDDADRRMRFLECQYRALNDIAKSARAELASESDSEWCREVQRRLQQTEFEKRAILDEIEEIEDSLLD